MQLQVFKGKRNFKLLSFSKDHRFKMLKWKLHSIKTLIKNLNIKNKGIKWNEKKTYLYFKLNFVVF